ncbi:acyltransferase family protein [Pontibacter chinhatensis]|uniref:Peptidoglycan/LPS O-acetylase OafA/YrhL, contains acyltransferase and SGNH-hydrolase domains n=1 Tax=Pontibacter chinhatensis TaxID=1436961 RepID=A0A1I2MB69_9BACT|nr:acyltransferase [Pontibacter chinhatensis]SFF88160.1 Peptidoglycan/LPS O-acetylase OafA/YrhL, contains acyltransferase and SGNH-hydrolase domains [Pontibacter chinhatensis]
MEKSDKIRRYEFDWLRVLAFSLLIFYHTGMFFVSWEWHVKNPEISEALERPMLFMNQWRMSLIFLVSGVGVYFAMGYRSAGTFAKDRLKRIFVPLLVGMLLIVPPQVYFERVVQGTASDYLSFYPSVFALEPYPEGNFSWHHLWYLAYIFCYSLLLLPLLMYLRRTSINGASIKGWMLLALPAIWLSIGGILLNQRFPATNALIDDWANHFLYISVFLIGFMLMKLPQLQDKVRRLRWHSLSMAITTVTILYTFYWFEDVDLNGAALDVYYVIRQSNRWFWLMAILGFAMQHLNRKHKYLAQANEMVYPFYILHQTVIVALAFYLLEADWSVGAKFTFISLSTFILCFLLVRYVVMPLNWLRVPFGLKPVQKRNVAAPKATAPEMMVAVTGKQS